MKRFVLFIAAFVCFISALHGCARSPKEVDKSNNGIFYICPPGEPDDNDGEAVIEMPVKLIRYDGWGTISKTILPCKLSTLLITELSAVVETGETAEKLSDGEIMDGGHHLPAEPETIWLEFGSDIYRYYQGNLWRVEGHLGAGRKLETSVELQRSIYDACYYYPYNYFSGRYDNDSGKLEMKNSYSAASSVEIRIKNIEIGKKPEPQSKIVLELISLLDQTLEIKLECMQSPDWVGSGDRKKVELQANKPQEIELGFYGWEDYSYWIEITADNTRLSITIIP